MEPSSSYKATWICATTGLSYQRTVRDQFRSTTKQSPYETHRLLATGYNDLATTHPEVSALWSDKNELSPSEVLPRSAEEVLWVCPESGAEYSRQIRHQVKSGGESPYMTNSAVLAGFNDLATIHPDIAAYWDHDKNSDRPSDYLPTSRAEVWWMSPDGESSHEPIYNVTQRHTKKNRAPSQKKAKNTSPRTHMVSRLYPYLEEFFDDTNDTDFSLLTNKDTGEYLWVDSFGAKTRNIISLVAASVRRYRKENGSTDGFSFLGGPPLSVTHPEIAELWSDDNDLSPDEVTSGSQKIIEWYCPEHGVAYTRKVRDQIKAEGVSPLVTGRVVVPGVNDIATIHPQIADTFSPSNEKSIEEVFAHDPEPMIWVCRSTREEYRRTIQNQVDNNGRSPHEDGLIAVTGFNDLGTTHPEIAALWSDKNSIRPDQITVRSKYVALLVSPDGHEFERQVRDCARRGIKYSPERNRSSGEIDLEDYIRSIYHGEIITGSRKIISPYEIDIYIPEENIGIEFNGLYWHSESNGKDRHYHHMKWSMAHDRGIQLITIWEDDWRDRSEIIKNMIAHKIGVASSRRVYGRSTTVEVIDSRTARDFCDAYHVQGSTVGSFYLGLKDSAGEIVAVSIWRKNGHTLYLDRYSTNCNVIGGMGKMLKNGKLWGTQNGCTKIITFSDHEVSDGGLYETLGFVVDKELKPDYSYFYRERRVHKFNFRLKRFRTDPELIYREGLSEKELAELNGIPRIWDSGKTRWKIVL